MADSADNALRACIKALTETIAPALDPKDPLAGEQLRLVLGFLSFFRQRMPLMHAREAFELQHALGLAQRLCDDARHLSPELAAALEQAIKQGLAVQQHPEPGLDALRNAAARLAAATSTLVRLCASATDAERATRVQRTVLDASRAWLDLRRAWFAPQGFEIHPDQVPVLDQVLGRG